MLNPLHKSVLAPLSSFSTLNITQKLNLDSKFQTRTIPNILAPCPGVFTVVETVVTNELVESLPETNHNLACFGWVFLKFCFIMPSIDV